MCNVVGRLSVYTHAMGYMIWALTSALGVTRFCSFIRQSAWVQVVAFRPADREIQPKRCRCKFLGLHTFGGTLLGRFVGGLPPWFGPAFQGSAVQSLWGPDVAQRSPSRDGCGCQARNVSPQTPRGKRCLQGRHQAPHRAFRIVREIIRTMSVLRKPLLAARLLKGI